MKADRSDKPNSLHPFVAPNGYFDALPTRVQQRISGRTTRSNVSGRALRWTSLAAGAVAVVALAVWFVVRPTSPTADPATASAAEQLLAEVPTETLVDYLLLAEVDVTSTASLSEAEQEALLEQFDTGDASDEFLLDNSGNENY